MVNWKILKKLFSKWSLSAIPLLNTQCNKEECGCQTSAWASCVGLVCIHKMVPTSVLCLSLFITLHGTGRWAPGNEVTGERNVHVSCAHGNKAKQTFCHLSHCAVRLLFWVGKTERWHKGSSPYSYGYTCMAAQWMVVLNCFASIVHICIPSPIYPQRRMWTSSNKLHQVTSLRLFRWRKEKITSRG